MTHQPGPHDAPPYPGMLLLGSLTWLKVRHFYLAGGTVWCLEGPHGDSPPRWTVVAPADLDAILIDGRTLAQLAAAKGTAETKQVPVVKVTRRPAAGE